MTNAKPLKHAALRLASEAAEAVVPKKPKGMTVGQLEQAILSNDGVRVVVRAPSNFFMKGVSYPFRKSFNDSLIETLENRIRGVLSKHLGDMLTFSIIDGSGRSKFSAKVTVSDLRRTYSHPLPR